ncbi:MAG TPA: hypothetical protein VHV57_17290 [Acidimicrobiales bacterium]|jgi:hypothetical protein|nr:hypothetical protein [Acidimicrobiales bacterium]
MHSTRRILGTLFAVVIGGAALTACGSSPAKTASDSTTTIAVQGTTVPTTTPTTATTATSGADQNLAVTAQVKSDLVAAYVAHSGLPASQIAGTAPGSVYYAFRPASNAYWALATFAPSPTADMNTQVAMQDDGCCGVFEQPVGGAWTYVRSTGYTGVPCPGQIPADLFTVWNLTVPGDCG